MAIGIPIKVRLTCEDCGWHIIGKQRGDVIDPVVVMFSCVKKCGRCGSPRLVTSRPSLFEYMNPFEGLKRTFYVAKVALMQFRNRQNR